MDKRVAAEVAAKWWMEQVANQIERTANLFGDPVTGHQLELFRLTLQRIILDDIDSDNWREDNPRWGSYMRTIGSDYGPDTKLDRAFKVAGIATIHCPIKTIMFINPDGVSTDTGFVWADAALRPKTLT